ncbi:MAG: hypothetical protein IIA33_11450, partial [Planctomycetes bacterium]|nr:hypothetical protein [Planctomycetota bacterium]
MFTPNQSNANDQGRGGAGGQIIIPVNLDGRELTKVVVRLTPEIKRKLEITQVSNDTVYNTLNRARGQLPKDRAGFVFLNIPDNWLSNPDAMDMLTGALKRLFGNTRRVTTVFIGREEFVHS